MTCYAFIAAWFMQWNDAMLLEYLQWVNAKCIAFFFFPYFFPLCSFVNFSNLHRGSPNLTPFSLFSLWNKWPFSKTKLPFLKVINITSFSFHRLQSIRVSFYTTTFILWQWLHFLKSFSPFFESFPIFRVHDASSLRTLTPFCLLKIPLVI